MFYEKKQESFFKSVCSFSEDNSNSSSKITKKNPAQGGDFHQFFVSLDGGQNPFFPQCGHLSTLSSFI
jgi:hypothetical protein